MEKELIVGSVVISTQGYDVNKIYVVKQVVNGNAYLINGKQRHYKNPKRKNLKHIKGLGMDYDFENKSENQINDDIIKLLKPLKSTKNL